MTVATRLLAWLGLAVVVVVGGALLSGCTIEASDPGVRYTRAPEPPLTALERVCRPLQARQARMVGDPDLAFVGFDSDADRARLATGYDRVAELGRTTLRRLDAVRPRPRGYARFRDAFEAAHVTVVVEVASALRTSGDFADPFAVDDAADRLEAASNRSARRSEQVGAPVCGAASVVPGLAFPPPLPDPPEYVAVPAPAAPDDGNTARDYAGLGLFALVPLAIGFPIGLFTTIGIRAGVVVAAVGATGTAAVLLFGEAYLDSQDGDLFDTLGDIFMVLVVGVASVGVVFVGLGLGAGALVRRLYLARLT